MRRILGVLALVSSAVAAGAPGAASASAPASGAVHTPAGTLQRSTSSHWSGYAAPAAPLSNFSSVSATWTQPAVACGAQNSYVALWAGIDGYNDGTVEQIGSEGDCVRGTAVYYAWYEMYPRPGFDIGTVAIHAGDSVTASVTAQFLGAFQLTITNNSTHATFSTTERAIFAQRSSAEVIVEAPSTRRSVLPLANFGTASFTNAVANGVGLGTYPTDPINMTDPAGGHATTGPFDSSKTKFSVSFSS